MAKRKTKDVKPVGSIVIDSELNDDWMKSLDGYKAEKRIHDELRAKLSNTSADFAQRRPFVHEVPVVRLDEAQRVAYGIVLQPDVADAQGHVMSAAEIEAACHRYMERQALDEHHAEDVAPQDARVVECWIQREPVTWRYGERETEVLPGSWCMAVKFYADELWAQVVDGAITGFSPKGRGRLSPVAE